MMRHNRLSNDARVTWDRVTMKPVAGPFGGSSSRYATTGAFGSRQVPTTLVGASALFSGELVDNRPIGRFSYPAEDMLSLLFGQQP